MKPLVSIITVVFNDKNIIKTIESIIPFLNDKVEAVIVDGNSTDGTRELIQKYADRIKILSETDKGIYDAINKGVSLASGTYILHINSGDYLLDIPIETLLKWQNNSDVVALSFPVLMNGKDVFYPSWNWRMRFKNTLHHQGTFYRRNIDFYDISYRVFADADLNKKLYKSKSIVKIYTMPCVANHLWNGIESEFIDDNRISILRRHEKMCADILLTGQVIMKHYGWFYLLIHFGYRLIEILLRKENKM